MRIFWRRSEQKAAVVYMGASGTKVGSDRLLLRIMDFTNFIVFLSHCILVFALVVINVFVCDLSLYLQAS